VSGSGISWAESISAEFGQQKSIVWQEKNMKWKAVSEHVQTDNSPMQTITPMTHHRLLLIGQTAAD